MHLLYDFTIMDMGDEIVAVPVGDNADNFHGMLRLNQTGAEIIELLKEEIDPMNVHKAMCEKYADSTPDEIGTIQADFFNMLLKEGVLIP